MTMFIIHFLQVHKCTSIISYTCTQPDIPAYNDRRQYTVSSGLQTCEIMQGARPDRSVNIGGVYAWSGKTNPFVVLDIPKGWCVGSVEMTLRAPSSIPTLSLSVHSAERLSTTTDRTTFSEAIHNGDIRTPVVMMNFTMLSWGLMGSHGDTFLPKVHKEGMRPIVSTIGSPTYRLAKELARILAPLVGNSGHSVKNSKAFVDRIRNMETLPQDLLASFDVTSFFTQVPVDDALRVVEAKLCADETLPERTSIPSAHLIELVELCLGSTYLEFQGRLYEQSDGAAMGSPLSPVIANMYMEHLEETALHTAPLQLTLWLRYVDDTFVAWLHGHEELQHFHEHINQQHPNIQFTIEEEKDGQLAFLDVQVTRSPDGLITSVYCKPTHTDRYIPFHSHHHQRTTTGVLRCMRDRAYQICSNTTREPELECLKEVFQANGFPEDLVRKTLTSHSTPASIPEPGQEPVKTLCTSYIRGLSEKLERVCSLGVRAAFKPVRTLKQTLMRLKTRIPDERKRGVVYEVLCKESSKTYVGETKRTLKVRLGEHKQAVKRGDPKKWKCCTCSRDPT